MYEDIYRRTVYKTYQRFEWLALGSMLNILISVLATIWLARLMGPENYGLYAAALIIPSIISAIGDLGVGRAVTFYTASLRSSDPRRALEYFKSALLVVCLQSAFFVAFIIASSSFLSALLFNREYLTPYLQVASLIVFYAIVSSVINGGFLSFEKQKMVALFMIAASIVRNFLAITFYINSGKTIMALVGQALGYSLIAVIYLVQALRSLRGVGINLKLALPMLRYGIPYAIGMLMITISFQFYNIIAASILDNEMYGNFSAAWLIFSAASVIPNALSISFLPSFSESFEMISKNIDIFYGPAAKFSATILVYFWLILGGFSNICVSIVYGNAYALAGDILSYLMSVFLLSIIGWDVISSLLLALKKTKTIATMSLSGTGISLVVFTTCQRLGFVETLWLIPYALFSLYLVYTLVGFIYLYKRYKAKPAGPSTIKMFAVSIFLFYLTREHGLGTKVVLKILGDSLLSYVLLIVLAAFWIGIVYLFVLASIGVIKKADYEIMKETILSFPVINFANIIVEGAIVAGIRTNSFLQKVFQKNSI
ncbi:MAG: oligosaccharide flippase family protein [Candidatus Korarchaeota archaeon]